MRQAGLSRLLALYRRLTAALLGAAAGRVVLALCRFAQLAPGKNKIGRRDRVRNAL